MKTLAKFTMFFTFVLGQTLEEIWIKTTNSGDVNAFRTHNVYDYYTSLSSYHLFPAQNRSIKFSVKACYAAFILLSAAVDLNSPDFYELSLGVGLDNAYTYLRRKYNTHECQRPYTPGIMNCAKHVTFILIWTVTGRITLTKDTDYGTEVVIDWTDATPFPIQGVGILFVIDSADNDRIDEAQELLDELLKHNELLGTPIVVVANKQDLDGAMKEKDIVELLELKHISGRLCTIQGTSAITGAGIHKALDNILRFRHHMESSRG
ncbi:Hypothetical predicted protein [Mytilus galloprovincialis]|uniref:Uncharacterized protein n=1 Tax=Mytilus galloprovincialis TaxID=29158 RepID=A0A8B6EZN9_MYTGA|nr:Hypothetical predicted protein [Mytilus galloprovincialis]